MLFFLDMVCPFEPPCVLCEAKDVELRSVALALKAAHDAVEIAPVAVGRLERGPLLRARQCLELLFTQHDTLHSRSTPLQCDRTSLAISSIGRCRLGVATRSEVLPRRAQCHPSPRRLRRLNSRSI